MDWQPIETAPKDGSELLLYGRCEFDGRLYAPDCNVGWWDTEGGIWNTRRDLIYATHWAPLPDKPA